MRYTQKHPQHTYIKRDVYYFSRVILSDLKHHYSKPRIIQSLKTKSAHRATVASNGLQQGIIDPKTLTAETLASIAASLADASGQPIPAKYKYTLRDALEDFRKLRRGEIQEKTLAAYDRAVALYLDDKSDVALDTI
jgi:hypothetical protein